MLVKCLAGLQVSSDMALSWQQQVLTDSLCSHTVLCCSLWSPNIVVVIHNSQLCSSPHAVISEVKPLLCIFQNYWMVNLQWSCFNDNNTHTDIQTMISIRVNLEYFEEPKTLKCSKLESAVWLHGYRNTKHIGLVTRWCIQQLWIFCVDSRHL